MMTANRRIPLIAGGVALILMIAFYFTVWGPQAKHLKAADKAHAAAEQQIGQLRSQVGQLQALVPEIPADNARFAQLQQALPNSPQLDQALTLLQQAAVQSGVTVANVSPTSPAGAASGTGPSASKTSGTPSITLTMSVLGSFNQVKAFLTTLDNLPRTIVVDKVSMSGGNQASASVTARIFYAGQPTP